MGQWARTQTNKTYPYRAVKQKQKNKTKPHNFSQWWYHNSNSKKNNVCTVGFPGKEKRKKEAEKLLENNGWKFP